jgi:acyl-CoA reductase-like NAD-dependent aldehyde dehydrogenase
MKPHKLYAAGSFIESTNVIDVVNPYNNKTFAKVFTADAEILEGAILSGQSIERDLRQWPVYKRFEVLIEIAQGIEEKRNDFAKTICLESGKPLKYALGEVDRAIQTYKIAAEESKRIPAEYLRLDWSSAGEGKEGFVKRFPVGLIAGISPFNFPLNLTAHKIAPAIAAGNPIILKPSSQTPLSILKLAEIIDKTSLPKGAISILPMNRELGDVLVTDPRIKLLSFTGSPDVGWHMKSRAGKKKIVLELGGNAGVYVSETADLKNAVPRCVVGGFAYSGQVCIHLQRLYIHAQVYHEFLELFISYVNKIVEGDPLDIGTDIAPLIDLKNALRVEDWVNQSIQEGASLICGGVRRDNYYPPTVLADTNNSMKVCAQEVFGPVVTVQSVNSIESAIEQINQSRYGLQAGIFTDSIDEMNFAYESLEVGGVVINDIPTFRVDHMPYGGVKDSGLGREGIKYAIEEMTEPRLLIKPFKK